jgi:hypothetical protein
MTVESIFTIISMALFFMAMITILDNANKK